MTFESQALTYAPHLLWMLNEGPGSVNAIDTSGNSRTGAYTSVGGFKDNSVLNDGSGAKIPYFTGSTMVSRGHETWMDMTALSLICGVIPYTTSGLGTIVTIDENGAAGDLGFRIRRNGSTIETILGSGASGSVSVGGIGINFYVLGWTHTGTRQKLFLNGVLVSEAASDPIPSPKLGALRLGRLQGGGEGWNGDLGPLAIFNPLPDNQMIDMYRASQGTLRYARTIQRRPLRGLIAR